MIQREKQTSKQKAILYLYEWIRALNAKPSLQLVEKSLIETWSSYLEGINKLVMTNDKRNDKQRKAFDNTKLYSPFQTFLAPVKEFLLNVERFCCVLCYWFLHDFLNLNMKKTMY